MGGNAYQNFGSILPSAILFLAQPVMEFTIEFILQKHHIFIHGFYCF